jgi:hypothetical protein
MATTMPEQKLLLRMSPEMQCSEPLGLLAVNPERVDARTVPTAQKDVKLFVGECVDQVTNGFCCPPGAVWGGGSHLFSMLAQTACRMPSTFCPGLLAPDLRALIVSFWLQYFGVCCCQCPGAASRRVPLIDNWDITWEDQGKRFHCKLQSNVGVATCCTPSISG